MLKACSPRGRQIDECDVEAGAHSSVARYTGIIHGRGPAYQAAWHGRPVHLETVSTKREFSRTGPETFGNSAAQNPETGARDESRIPQRPQLAGILASSGRRGGTSDCLADLEGFEIPCSPFKKLLWQPEADSVRAGVRPDYHLVDVGARSRRSFRRGIVG